MNLLGANWRTSVWGGITLVATAVAVNPTLIAFLPDSIEGYVRGACGLIAFVSGGVFVANVKDKQVTGGSIAQTLSGNVAAPGTQTLVDETVKTSVASGEPITLAQREAVKP